MDAFPKLRSDLQVSDQRSREGLVHVIKDPTSGRIFRLPEVEYFVARQLDGVTAPDLVRQKVDARFGAGLAADTLAAFVAQLRRLGLIEDAGVAPASTARGRVRGDLLYLRFPAFDPDVWLGRLLRRLRFCFTPGFVAFAAAAMVAAVAVAVSNAQELRQEFTGLANFHAIAYAWLILLTTASLHEIAHGLTCKHFGGQVREMGFMLIYFQPALYCNVSDAWLFPRKAARLWVTFAGAGFDLFLWALGVLMWRVTDPDTALHFTGLVFVATLGIRTLFNLNPLIKLDGYYLLSDLLEIPNLRARAFSFLRGRWDRFWYGSEPIGEPTPARERRIFWAYGILAGVYSVTLLGSIAWWFGHYLVERLGALGFLLFAVLLSVALRHPLRRTLLKLPQGLRRGPSWFASLPRPFKFAAVAGVLIAGMFLIPMRLTVSGPVTILPYENADVRAEVEGALSEIFVAEGDVVEPGAPIARISDEKYRTELNEVEAAIREKQARLRQLQTGSGAAPSVARLAAAQATVAKAREQLRKAESDLARMRTLIDAGLFARARLEQGESEVVIRRRELEEAQAALQVVRGDAEAMQAEMASLEVRRDYLQGQLERVLVRTPHAGVITTPKVEQKVGQYVKEGDLIAEVHERKRVIAEIAVPEREIGDVRIGQPVLLKARAYPSVTFRGVVSRIAPATEESEQLATTRVVRVTTVIDNPGHLLKTGMTGYAKIEGDERRLIDVLARSIVGTVRVEVWSWW